MTFPKLQHTLEVNVYLLTKIRYTEVKLRTVPIVKSFSYKGSHHNHIIIVNDDCGNRSAAPIVVMTSRTH